MKHLFTFLAGFTILMSSCSSSRKAGQTPDDIYYSPSGTKATASASSNQGEYYSTAPSDQYVHMRVQNPDRWSYFDDYSAYDSYYSPAGGMGFGYGYPSYGFGYGGYGSTIGLGFGDPYFGWNSYFLWNSWYNPYFYNPYYGGGVLVYGHQAAAPAVYSHLSTFNTGSYGGALVRNTNSTSLSSRNRLYRPGMTTTTNYNSNLGRSSTTRTVNGNNYYRAGNNGNGNSGYRPSYNSQPTRSFAPVSSGSGSSGGGFGRPGRH